MLRPHKVAPVATYITCRSKGVRSLSTSAPKSFSAFGSIACVRTRRRNDGCTVGSGGPLVECGVNKATELQSEVDRQHQQCWPPPDSFTRRPQFFISLKLCRTSSTRSQHDDVSRLATVKLDTVRHAGGGETPTGFGLYCSCSKNTG